MSESAGLEGRIVGNYVLRTLIDQGGVGLVYLGEHRYLGDKVAVKVLHKHIDLEENDMARRFFQEARATRAIEHPNVVRILDFGQDPSDGLLYLVMEFLEGTSIIDLLEHGPIDERTTARVGAAVADGLQAAHDKGVIHRDLKPGNIFLCRDGTVKLLDFGLAKVLDKNSMTAAGIVVGTPQYLAPEQVLQPQLVGPRTDVYGLGAVMFRMLAGRLPFVSDDMIELVQHHLQTPPPRLSSLARVSPAMEALVMECLEKELVRRPPSMRAVRDRLLQVMNLAPEPAAAQPVPPGEATLVDAVMTRDLALALMTPAAVDATHPAHSLGATADVTAVDAAPPVAAAISDRKLAAAHPPLNAFGDSTVVDSGQASAMAEIVARARAASSPVIESTSPRGEVLHTQRVKPLPRDLPPPASSSPQKTRAFAIAGAVALLAAVVLGAFAAWLFTRPAKPAVKPPQGGLQIGFPPSTPPQ